MKVDASKNPQQLLADSRVLVDTQSVRQAVDRWAVSIDIGLGMKLAGQPVIAIAIMRGALISTAWLLQRLKMPVIIEYAHATRYRSGTQGNELEWKHYPEIELQGQPVLIIDDIFDEGYTMEAMQQWCLEQGASQVTTAALVRKQHQRGLSRDWLDYAALDIEDKYVFGCGMDIFEHWRHLPNIRVYQPNEAS